MPPTHLIDLTRIDLGKVLYGSEKIEALNPQRGDMRHLDAIVHLDEEERVIVGVKHVRANEFWVPGHIPGRPLLPGVIMIEAAAQLSAFAMKHKMPELGFVGFVGADAVKFRGQVLPGDDLYLIAKLVQLKPRRFICESQGIVKGTLVFEAQITGMPI